LKQACVSLLWILTIRSYCSDFHDWQLLSALVYCDPVSNSPERSYFIQRNGRQHGPCTLDEIRSYLSYGSLAATDLVWDQDADQWLPAQQVVNPSGEEGPLGYEFMAEESWKERLAGLGKGLVGLWQRLNGAGKPNAPRRVVRYRDYNRVPQRERASTVLADMFWGTLFFPPRLWAACSTLFTKRVFRNATNDQGYLKELPRFFEALGAVLIVVNALAWALLFHWAWTVAVPTTMQLVEAVKGAFQEHFGSGASLLK
jgi:hypothetical protein